MQNFSFLSVISDSVEGHILGWEWGLHSAGVGAIGSGRKETTKVSLS